MKKLYTSLLVVGLGISAFGAATTTPIGTTDKQAYPQPNYAGVKTCVIGLSTGTSAVLCTPNGFSSQTPSSAPISGIILQIIGSSLTATSDYLTIRDSSTYNLTSSTLVVYGQGTQSTPVGGVILPRFKNGLVANTNATLGTAGAWTIVYTTDLY